jgi:hypothetical protein
MVHRMPYRVHLDEECCPWQRCHLRRFIAHVMERFVVHLRALEIVVGQHRCVVCTAMRGPDAHSTPSMSALPL